MTYTTHYNLKKPDLTDLVDVTDLNDNSDTIDTAVYGKEDSSNKVTSIDNQSTDTQYPSAKCVYDLLSQTEAKYTEIWDHDNVCKFTKSELETMFSQKTPMCYQSHIVFLARSEEDGTKINVYYLTSITGAPKWNPIVYRISVDGSKNIVTDVPTANFFSGNYNDLSNKLTAGTNITISANNEISATGGGEFPVGTNAGDILVWNGSAWVSKPKWQMTYQPVEYIQNSGTQWIYLTEQFTADRLVVDFQYITIPSGGELIAADGDPGFDNGVLTAGGNATVFRYFIGGTGSGGHSYGTTDTNRHTFDVRLGSQYFDGELIGSYTATNKTAYHYLLNSINSADGLIPTEARIYSASWYYNNSKIVDLVPCYRISDGEIGVYDIVNHKFYTNAGTGTFVKGADV